ncbi:MAG TPA: hypothetical protein VK717_07065 [Opitutaceae bacterium]|jgi:hypothetical protein|nr:hypothetical protein [Opitutaceae bacterium]
MAAFQPPGDCPACGEFVPAGRKSCPHCGSDARSGWSDEAEYDGLDLPGEAFNYRDFVQEEFGQGGRRTRPTLFWWIIGLGLLAALIWTFAVVWH